MLGRRQSLVPRVFVKFEAGSQSISDTEGVKNLKSKLPLAQSRRRHLEPQLCVRQTLGCGYHETVWAHGEYD